MRVALYAGMFKQNHDGSVKTLFELVDSLLQKDNMEVGVWGFSMTPQERKGLSLYHILSIPLPLYPDYRITIPNPKLKKQLKKFNPDVIHITVPDLVGMYLIRYANKRGIPVLTSFHTDFPAYLKSYHLGFLYKTAWKFLKWFYNKTALTLAPTKEIIVKLKSKGIKHVNLWSRGIHLHRYSTAFYSEALRSSWKASNKKVILYCGRFVWYKDLETFIEVYDLFKTHGPDNVVFVLAGDGPIRDELEQRMPDAFFPGYLQGEDLSKVYASSDIFLFPSTTETFGNVVLEALASGLPVVVSNVGGCKEIARKSRAGLVARAENPQDFYQKCKHLVENQASYNKMKEKAVQYVINHSWETINNQVIEEYRYMILKNKQKLRAAAGILVSDY